MAKSPNPYPLRKKPYPRSRKPMREPYCNDDAGGQSVTVRHSPKEFRGDHTHLRGSVWCPRNLWARIPGDDAIKAILSPWPVERPVDRTDRVNAPLSAKELAWLRVSVERGRPFGEDEWVKRTASELRLGLIVRPEGRPLFNYRSPHLLSSDKTRHLVPVKLPPVSGANPAVPLPVRPSRKRGPGILPWHSKKKSFPFWRTRHRVPVNFPPVSGANPTVPLPVRPSRKRGPGISPWHSRKISEPIFTD